jgi:hypothetical protein
MRLAKILDWKGLKINISFALKCFSSFYTGHKFVITGQWRDVQDIWVEQYNRYCYVCVERNKSYIF